MSLFDTPAGSGVVGIRLECVSKVEGTDGLWWVAESLADGTSQPRGVFTDVKAAETRAEELAAEHGVKVERMSYT